METQSSKKYIKDIFLNTKNIAIYGLSPDTSKASNRVSSYLQNVGFKIFPIYPKEDLILGEVVHRDLTTISDNIDMVIVFRKSEFANQVFDEISGRKDIKTLWLQLGIENDEVAKKVQTRGLNFVQNKCSMVEHNRIFSV